MVLEATVVWYVTALCELNDAYGCLLAYRAYARAAAVSPRTSTSSPRISIDNSEWMRNGDYRPSRMEAQIEAVQLVCAAKTRGNPESTVSVMTLANKYVLALPKGLSAMRLDLRGMVSRHRTTRQMLCRCEMLATLTQDLGKIITSLHDVKIAQVCIHPPTLASWAAAYLIRPSQRGAMRMLVALCCACHFTLNVSPCVTRHA